MFRGLLSATLSVAHKLHLESFLSKPGRAFSSGLPDRVGIYEVGPRDGLQNEKELIPTSIKVDLINRLTDAGLKSIEVTSFVSPKWVPQLADAADVLRTMHWQAGVKYPVLTPNLKGFERALEAGAKEVAIFASASEAFSQKNLNCSIKDSLKKFGDVAASAQKHNIAVRGYVSCVVGCPYQGAVPASTAADVAKTLMGMGCYEVSMADTTGVGTAGDVKRMFEACLKSIPAQQLGAHMHDTYGQALANLLASLQMGISIIDSSVAGLGGCPYAKGATGNVATEDVVYMLEGLGIKHGIDMDKLLDASEMISQALKRPNASRAATALLNKRGA